GVGSTQRSGCSGVDAEWGGRVVLRGMAGGRGNRISKALFSLVAGRTLPSVDGRRAEDERASAYGRREGAGAAMAFDGAADCISQESACRNERPGGAGVCRGSGVVLSSVGGMRFLPGGDRTADGADQRSRHDQ